MGNALTISAMLAPSVKHMQAPRIQHHTTEEGPPTRRGVLNVVAILEQRPIMLKAKLICKIFSPCSRKDVYETYGGEIGKFPLE